MSKFKNKNKISSSWLIASLAISIVLYLFSIIVSWYGTIILALMLFVPTLLVLLIYIISKKNINKFPKATKIISTSLNILVVIFFQLFICGTITIIFSGVLVRDVTNIKDYNRAINTISSQEKIAHFPKKLPNNLMNPELCQSIDGIFGSEQIMLAYNLDEKEIEQELAKYKFEQIEGPFKNSENYNYLIKYLNCNNLNISGYTNFIIGIKETREKGFPYIYGILINKDRTKIVYYYVSPD